MVGVRHPARAKTPTKAPILSSLSLPAPYKGWNARDPEALMQDSYALSMVNCFPSTAAVALRPGAANFRTEMSSAVKALHSYTPTSGAPKLFASDDSGLKDVSTAGTGGSIVSANSSGFTRAVNFRTTGASNLIVVNGVDNLRVFNGTTWSSPASYTITTGGTLLSSNIVNLAVYKRRLFVAEKDSLNVYSFAVDSIAGNVDLIPLGALFDKGGYIVAIGSWSLATIAGGVPDKVCFVSSRGQVAVYAGIDPIDPSNWALQGVYNLAEPLGFDCLLKYGSDLLYLCKTGIFPLSQALQSTTIATAISDTVRDAFIQAALLYGNNRGWCMEIDEPNSLLVVNVPITSLGYSQQFVMNLVTKAWCSFINWNAFCFRYHNGQLYMGMQAKVAKAYTGLNDFGSLIIGTTKQAPSYLGQRGLNKHIEHLRPVLKIQGQASVEIAVDTDFQNVAQFGPTSFVSGGGATWDTSEWVGDGETGGATWADDGGIRLNWLSAPHYPGYALSLRLRLSSDAAKVSWTATDLLFQQGSFT